MKTYAQFIGESVATSLLKVIAKAGKASEYNSEVKANDDGTLRFTDLDLGVTKTVEVLGRAKYKVTNITQKNNHTSVIITNKHALLYDLGVVNAPNKLQRESKSQSISVGSTVSISKYDSSSNTSGPTDVKIVDYVKKPGQRDMVHFKVDGESKVRKLAVNIFKSKMKSSVQEGLFSKSVTFTIGDRVKVNKKHLAPSMIGKEGKVSVIVNGRNGEVIVDFGSNLVKGFSPSELDLIK